MSMTYGAFMRRESKAEQEQLEIEKIQLEVIDLLKNSNLIIDDYYNDTVCDLVSEIFKSQPKTGFKNADLGFWRNTQNVI